MRRLVERGEGVAWLVTGGKIIRAPPRVNLLSSTSCHAGPAPTKPAIYRQLPAEPAACQAALQTRRIPALPVLRKLGALLEIGQSWGIKGSRYSVSSMQRFSPRLPWEKSDNFPRMPAEEWASHLREMESLSFGHLALLTRIQTLHRESFYLQKGCNTVKARLTSSCTGWGETMSPRPAIKARKTQVEPLDMQDTYTSSAIRPIVAVHHKCLT